MSSSGGSINTRTSCSENRISRNLKKSSKTQYGEVHLDDDDFEYVISYEISMAVGKKPKQKPNRHFSEVESSPGYLQVGTGYEMKLKATRKHNRRFSELENVARDSRDNTGYEALFPPAVVEPYDKSRKERAKKYELPRSETSRSIASSIGPEYVTFARSGSSEAALKEAERNLFDEFYLGAMKSSSVYKYLKRSEFCLYYKLPKSHREISTCAPLQIGYMSSDGTVYHFPVACTNPDTPQESWHVATGERQVVAFSTLSAMLRYHKIYSYINPRTGKIETFPISHCGSGE